MTDYINEFINSTGNENDEMFNQGLILVRAVADGWKPSAIKRECGLATGKGKRTMDNRYLVGRVFGDNYAADMDWTLHLACCTAEGVKADDESTHAIAHNWLDTAIAGYTDDNGNQRPHSAATLKAAIRATVADGKRKAETVYKGEMVIRNVDGCGYYMEVDFEETIIGKLKEGETVTVTIVRQTSPETEAAK